MTLGQLAQLLHVAATIAPQLLQIIFRATDVSTQIFERSFRIALRFADDELCFALRLLANFSAQLLGTDQRIIQRFVTFAKSTQLLVKIARLISSS